jgi:hypothetical protein
VVACVGREVELREDADATEIVRVDDTFVRQ